MKVRLKSIVEGIEFQDLESQSYLNIETREVVLIADEYTDAIEFDSDISGQGDWYKEAIALTKEFLDNQDRYIELPSKDDLDEYRVMARFISTIPIEEQREEMFDLIEGKGAFSRFRQGLDRFLLTDQWYKYKNLAIVKIAKDWCKVNEIEYEDDTKN